MLLAAIALPQQLLLADPGDAAHPVAVDVAVAHHDEVKADSDSADAHGGTAVKAKGGLFGSNNEADGAKVRAAQTADEQAKDGFFDATTAASADARAVRVDKNTNAFFAAVASPFVATSRFITAAGNDVWSFVSFPFVSHFKVNAEACAVSAAKRPTVSVTRLGSDSATRALFNGKIVKAKVNTATLGTCSVSAVLLTANPSLPIATLAVDVVPVSTTFNVSKKQAAGKLIGALAEKYTFADKEGKLMTVHQAENFLNTHWQIDMFIEQRALALQAALEVDKAESQELQLGIVSLGITLKYTTLGYPRNVAQEPTGTEPTRSSWSASEQKANLDAALKTNYKNFMQVVTAL